MIALRKLLLIPIVDRRSYIVDRRKNTKIQIRRNFTIAMMTLFVLSGNAQSSPQEDTAKKVTLRTFDKVEIESEFPGGTKGWYDFLYSKLVYPKKAYRKKIEGQVVAKFIVEKDGSLSNIEITSGPPELWQAVMDVLLESPKWTPAVQNGKVVRSYKSQPINFRLEKQ